MSNDIWNKTDKMATTIRVVGAILALVASAYAVYPIAKNILGLSRVSEIRNARVVYSLSKRKGRYTVEVKKLRSDCPVKSLTMGTNVNNRVHNIELDKKPYQLLNLRGWTFLEFNAVITDAKKIGKDVMFGVVQYECPEGIITVQFPKDSTAEIVR